LGISQLPPELVDHPDYEIVRELGRGGMGVVYLAQNKLAGRPEVLKVVGRPQIERPGAADRFLREIRSTAKLHHLNAERTRSAYRQFRFTKRSCERGKTCKRSGRLGRTDGSCQPFQWIGPKAAG
jgi:serine/threonine protein kinase